MDEVLRAISRKRCGHWVAGSGICGVFCVSTEAGKDCEWEEEDVKNKHGSRGCSEMGSDGRCGLVRYGRCFTLETTCKLRDTLISDAQGWY